MNGTSEISNELRSLSAIVAEIGRLTPYTVPDGYFNQLPGRVLEKVAAWKDAKSLIYSVPDGYFDRFAQGVLAKIKAGESKDIVADESKDIVAREALADPFSEILARVGRITPYQTPEGYFEELSPLLAVCRDKNPYTAPDGYFESLSEVVTARTGRTRVHKAVVRRISWMKYSVAAVLAGLILTVGWLRWNRSGTSHQPYDAAALSKVSDAELQSFLVDQDATLAQPMPNATATIDINDTDLKALMGDVPDGELKQYMEEHGGANDIGTN